MDEAMAPIDPASVLAYTFPQETYSYDEKGVVLYALGVGACGADPCDPIELPYVNNSFGRPSLKVLPTLPVIFVCNAAKELAAVPGLNHDPSLLLHGEQSLEIYKPLSTSCQVKFVPRISQLIDKGKAVVVQIECLCKDANSGEALCMNRMTCFLRGAGGFSASSSEPFSYDNCTPTIISSNKISTKSPDFPPFATYEDHIHVNQALIYQLSGDDNPLHSDPEFASLAGFSRPILHGLCTLGFAVRAVIRCSCSGEPSLVQTVQGRFLLHVYPGETLVTKMWRDKTFPGKIIFHCEVKERQKLVLSGEVILRASALL